ncbi:carboxyl-terminal processing protease [Emiliania huxleyi CCMP1516]|uniref:PDZ domain-containing protein n=2 Tax=Emiliania huxleyi TaxID=2903 RepID=A0A0D3JMX6_EMIH1|nr:carboxyl-terminal processing protease [Emiliania huxleyi CCMP1516]EOD24861.1 carboxyl-terminal processing protease [Emiliania huxleyi CCMP1516]|eukprot:XP_005777290.1 carboxyl-terminal processing protease [Emiliania huxleyi CCMP1516]
MRLPRPPHAPPLAPIARAAASSLASVLLASSLLGGDVGPQLGPAAAFASQPLTEEQKLVAEAWRVTDREFVDREFGGQDWFSVRQKMLKQRYDSRVDAYDQVRAMLAALDDKYTRFLTPSAYDAVFATATGGVVGIGVELQTETEPSNRVTINNVVPGGPADRAGVRPGDEIVNADGEDCTRLSAEEASKYVRGAAGSKIGAWGPRPRPEPAPPSPQVKLAAVTKSSATLGGVPVGFVTIRQFSTSTAADVKAALADALVLDLRGNTGGYFTGGVDAAAAQGTADHVRDRQPSQRGMDTETPLYLLVDSRTASASEILSSALQDNGRAKLIGCSGARPRGRDGRRPRTFGKAVIQTVSPLSDGSGIVVTTARYQTPQRTDINKKGIAVDMEKDCPISTEAAKCLPSKLV